MNLQGSMRAAALDYTSLRLLHEVQGPRRRAALPCRARRAGGPAAAMLERGSSRLSRHPPAAVCAPLSAAARGEARRDRRCCTGSSTQPWPGNCAGAEAALNKNAALLCSLVRNQVPSAVQKLPNGSEKKEGPGGAMREPAPAAMQPPRRRRVELRARGTGAARVVGAARPATPACSTAQRPCPFPASPHRPAVPAVPCAAFASLRLACDALLHSSQHNHHHRLGLTRPSHTHHTPTGALVSRAPPPHTHLPNRPSQLPSRPLIPHTARPACRSPPRRMASSR